MIYKGYFRDINEVLYKVEIITENDSSKEADEELLLAGDEPVVIEYKGKNDDAYKPYKCSSATISILCTEPYFEFNDTFGNSVQVNIYREGKVIWCGFATPNAYSQKFEDSYDEYELECQDALSTLQYFSYQRIASYDNKHYPDSMDLPYGGFDAQHLNHADPTAESNLLTANSGNPCTNFIHIITNWNKNHLFNSYKHIYFTDSIYIPNVKDISLLDALFISENNFIDEDGEPMNDLDILEEMCRIMGVVCVPYGDALYFLNYDAIAKGMNSYFHYILNNDYFVEDGKADLVSDIDINIDSFSKNGTKINIDSVFNKVTVKDDLYSVDSLTPDIEDNNYLVYSNYKDSTGYVDEDNFITESDNGEVKIENIKHDKQWVFMKYYGRDWVQDLNNRYIFYYYNGDYYDANKTSTDYKEDGSHYHTGGEVEKHEIYTNKNFTFGTTKNYVGACLVDYAVKKVDEWDDLVTTVDYDRAIFIHCNSFWDKPDKDYSDWSSIEWHKSKGAVWVRKGYQKVFKLIQDYQMLSQNQYFVISGKFKFFHDNEILPIDEGDDAKVHSKYCWEWARLKFADKYWDGITWVNEPCDFRLPFEYDKDKKAWNNEISPKNTVSYRMNLEEEGYCIPVPSPLSIRITDTELGTMGRMEFTFYRPSGLNQDICRSCIIKDFDIKVCGEKDNVINDDEDNTEYTNVIKHGATEEYDDISCKICTYDYKSFNWSQIFYIHTVKDDSVSWEIPVSFANDTCTFRLYNDTDRLVKDGLSIQYNNFKYKRATLFYDKALGYYLRPEQLIISRLCTQYSNPTLTIDCNLKNDLGLMPYSKVTYNSQFPDVMFTVDEMEYDLQLNRCSIKILNKKIEYET